MWIAHQAHRARFRVRDDCSHRARTRGLNGLVVLELTVAMLLRFSVLFRRTPYYIGKPNPLIMRAALSKLQVARTEACIVGECTRICCGLSFCMLPWG